MAQEFVVERDPRGHYFLYPVSKAVDTREAGGKSWTTYDRPAEPPIRMVRDMKEAREWIRKAKGKLKEVVDLTTWTAEQMPARYPWVTKKQAQDIVKEGKKYQKVQARMEDRQLRQRPLRSNIGKRRRM